ncbi:grasp-with-spasm system ATP-grasp peptide maturase [Chryseobacterium sp. CBo1]|uniref:grasp-with-spasm system ATP-grasp peptide maturase n=1 Tax=Chryseobacterium sp. CBo1 TaxID=1869230 RepID=UPI000810BB41|nr:grasp-with-spasm system ATP-grasp peptide maturase [Chryseobacterium sp. CBo1]OCK52800.1 grasp-with-spasm system ATP-grasp peptide maturase [Chryseobacterium sp. CBo1]
MILIFSQAEFEYTTDVIYEWIVHLGGNVRRVNGRTLMESKNFKIDFTSSKRNLALNDINIDDVNIIWYRRWMGQYSFDKKRDLNAFLKREFRSLSQYFFSCFSTDKWYNKDSYQKDYASKSAQLFFASKNGFKIPTTLITTNKKELVKFIEENDSVIMKPIGDIDTFHDKIQKKNLAPFTERIDENIINNLKETFFPTLFQKEIKKKLEVRVFFDSGDIYSMAIFSASNKETEIDFRQYDNKLPNRNVPFNLTDIEEKKIRKFMKDVDLQTGSLDFIFDLNNELYFLEVNPLGQFGMVSLPCNYNIEKKIAEKLILIDNEKNKNTTFRKDETC